MFGTKLSTVLGGQVVAQLVKALRYKPEGTGFDFAFRSPEFFIDIILPGRNTALGSAQPLTEMNTRNISWR